MDAFSVILLMVTGVGLITFLLRLESWPNNRLAGPFPAGDTAWAMSEENVEIVRRLYDTVARGDAAAVLALYDAEVEWDMSRGPLAGLTGWGVYRGHEGLRRFFRERYEAWENMEDDCEELIDAGNHVISVTTTRGRGRGSGVEIEGKNASVWTIQEGKIVRVVWFETRDEALEAAGLSR